MFGKQPGKRIGDLSQALQGQPVGLVRTANQRNDDRPRQGSK